MKGSRVTDSTAYWHKRIARRFEASPEKLISALQFVQREAGHLPREALTALAQHLRVSESKAFGVATFYSLFRLTPRGRNQVTVCRGTACHVQGSGRLLKGLEEMLGVKAGGTTADGLFSLDTVGCLGTCALATPVVINGRLYGRQSVASARRLVKQAMAAAKGTSAREPSSRSGGRKGRRVV